MRVICLEIGRMMDAESLEMSRTMGAGSTKVPK